jgi:hypothetical protein
MWAEESLEVKEHYKNLAAAKKQQLLLDHPNWKCSPRKSSDIKKRSISAESPPKPSTMHQLGINLAKEGSAPNESSDKTLGGVGILQNSSGDFFYASFPRVNLSESRATYSALNLGINDVQTQIAGPASQMNAFTFNQSQGMQDSALRSQLTLNQQVATGASFSSLNQNQTDPALEAILNSTQPPSHWSAMTQTQQEFQNEDAFADPFSQDFADQLPLMSEDEDDDNDSGSENLL